MKPSVSIIVTNYNYAEFLKWCLDSALAVDYEPKEIIVVDDGSVDESRAIITAYQESHPSVQVIMKENAGQVAAVNDGFRRSTGDIVYFLDADDVVYRHMMERVASVWGPAVSKVQFCLATIDETGAKLGNVFPHYTVGLEPLSVREALVRSGEYVMPPTSGNVYSRWYLDKIMPLDETKFRYSDGPMNTAAPLYGDVVTIDELLGEYRMHQNNAWGKRVFDVRTYTTAVEHNLALTEFLLSHCRKLNISCTDRPSDTAPLAMQYRMASVKLRPKFHPINETIWRVMWLGLKAVMGSSSTSAMQKSVLVPWFIFMAITPRKVAEELTKVRFTPSYRPKIVTRMLRHFGALRNTSMAH